MDRAEYIERWRELQMYRGFAAVRWEHRDVETNDYSPVSMKRLRSDVRSLKAGLKSESPSFKMKERRRTVETLDLLLETGPKTKRALVWDWGKEPKLVKTLPHRAATNYHLIIGHMWHRRVWQPIFSHTVPTKWQIPNKYFVLSADRVRVNNDLMEVYEVKVADRTSNVTFVSGIAECPTTSGYVAVTKNSRIPFFAFAAHNAIKAAAAQVAHEVDTIITKGNHDD